MTFMLAAKALSKASMDAFGFVNTYEHDDLSPKQDITAVPFSMSVGFWRHGCRRNVSNDLFGMVFVR